MICDLLFKFRSGLKEDRCLTSLELHVLSISSDWLGLDEVPEDRREDFVEVRRKPPCRGSRERRKLFEAAVGPIIQD